MINKDLSSSLPFVGACKRGKNFDKIITANMYKALTTNNLHPLPELKPVVIVDLDKVLFLSKALLSKIQGTKVNL